MGFLMNEKQKEILKQIDKNGRKQGSINAKINLSPELKAFDITCYKTHIKLGLAGVISLIVGMLFLPILLISIMLFVGSLVCMAINRKRINEERQIRIKIKNKIREKIENEND